MRIELCGGIASGKTTLVTSLSELEMLPEYERFSENPFFTKFYADPTTHAFETEITYLLQHFSQIRDVTSMPRVAFDFSLALDVAYAYVTMLPEDRRVFEVVVDHILEKIGLPALIIRLKCESKIELQRIRDRHRPAEQALSIDYLGTLDASIERVLRSSRFRSIPVLAIDSSKCDFRPNGRDQEAVRSRVMAAIDAHCRASI